MVERTSHGEFRFPLPDGVVGVRHGCVSFFSLFLDAILSSRRRRLSRTHLNFGQNAHSRMVVVRESGCRIRTDDDWDRFLGVEAIREKLREPHQPWTCDLRPVICIAWCLACISRVAKQCVSPDRRGGCSSRRGWRLRPGVGVVVHGGHGGCREVSGLSMVKRESEADNTTHLALAPRCSEK